LNELASSFTHQEHAMSTHELVPVGPALQLPIARMRSVYRANDVERKLAQLHASANEREHEGLRTTYQRMLDRGPERFAVKPSGVPDMGALYDLLPNFTEVLDDVKRHVALCQDSQDGLQVTPLLLLGPPGVGKTHFAKHIAELLGTCMQLVPMSSMTAGWLLSGSSSQWKGAKPGKVFQALVDGEYANPVIVIDEIDKASADAQYDPLGPLYSLLEHDTASQFVDEYAEVPIDASQVIWITTANDERGIPAPILNRMNVFDIQPPDAAAARKIAAHLYQSICEEHDWGKRFEPMLSADVLDMLAALAPRDMRRALMTALGNARLAQRYAIEPADMPALHSTKSRLGFLQ
jgi:ATP-dependent Lon protease